MGIFASSNFPGVASTELAASDANWSKVSGFTANALLDGVGGVYDQFGNNDFYQYAVAPPSADYEVEVTLPTQLVTNYSGGPVIRVVGQTFYTVFWHGGTQSWALQRYDSAGSSTYLNTSAVSPTPVLGGALVIGFLNGNIYVTYQGTPVYNQAESTYTAAGNPGVMPPNPSTLAVTAWKARSLSEYISVGVGAITFAGLQPTAPILGAQILAPISDGSNTGWAPSVSGVDIYTLLDEPIPLDDSDYGFSPNPGVNFTVALQAGTDPNMATGHIAHYRIRADAGGMVVTLKQGSTTIASWTHSPAPADWTTYAQTLTSGEANSITDYTNLRLYFEATT